jgi:hypothetical protein
LKSGLFKPMIFGHFISLLTSGGGGNSGSSGGGGVGAGGPNCPANQPNCGFGLEACGQGGVVNCPPQQIQDFDLTSVPQAATLHPLEGNTVTRIPIYDYSFRPPKLIGYRIVSYAYDNVNVDPAGIPGLFLPIPSIKNPASLNNVEIAYSLGWNFTKRGLENLAGLGIVATCQPCVAVGVGLKALSVLENTNNMVTIDSHVRSRDVYFLSYEFEIGNPLDEFIYQKVP